MSQSVFLFDFLCVSSSGFYLFACLHLPLLSLSFLYVSFCQSYVPFFTLHSLWWSLFTHPMSFCLYASFCQSWVSCARLNVVLSFSVIFLSFYLYLSVSVGFDLLVYTSLSAPLSLSHTVLCTCRILSLFGSICLSVWILLTVKPTALKQQSFPNEKENKA